MGLEMGHNGRLAQKTQQASAVALGLIWVDQAMKLLLDLLPSHGPLYEKVPA